MNLRLLDKSIQPDAEVLFESAFSASEGVDEGQLIGKLASDIAAIIDGKEVIGCGVFDKRRLTGAIFFSQLRFDEPSAVYMLAPVAVATDYQRAGIGQALIRFGIDELKSRGIRVLVTYGDPNYYGRFGFQALSQEVLQPPYVLSMPQGWLGLALDNQEIPALKGVARCASPFNNPLYW